MDSNELGEILTEQSAAVAADELDHGADQPLVLFELSRVAAHGGMCLLLPLHDDIRLADELFPGLRRLESVPCQEIRAIEQHAAVDTAGHAVDVVAILAGSDRGRQELLPVNERKQIVECERPPGRGEFRYPNDVHEKQIDGRVVIFQFLGQEIVIGGGGVRSDLAHDVEICGWLRQTCRAPHPMREGGRPSRRRSGG